MATSRIKTLSLFSGAGGLDIGFHQAGFNILGCVEIEPAYAKTLAANCGAGKFFGPHLQIHCEDIRQFDPAPYLSQGVECIIGGPPCQTFSAAGRRSGGVLGTVDPRGRLFESYCRILEAVAPRVFVFENVYGLPGANGGGPWREICSAFGRLGYQLRAEVLDSADYGVPQHRERLIIVGYRDKGSTFEFPMPTHGPDSPEDLPLVSVLDAIEDLQDPSEPFHTFDGLYGHLLPQVPEGLNYSFFTREMGYPKPFFAWRSKFHDFLYKVDPSSPTRTIKAQPGKFTGPFHWKNRHFTVAELKRLQSFPDLYDLIGSFGKVVEQIGNSVPPKLAYVIATSVREQLLNSTRQLTFRTRPAGFVSTFRQRQRERTHHFKAVAHQTIQKRFPNIHPIEKSKANSRSKYFVGYDGFFDKHISDSLPEQSQRRYFAVAERRTGTDIRLEVSPCEDAVSRNCTISISGLSKYLLSVDSLTCTAKIKSPLDVFHVWDIIEDSVTRDSQFFTLIDIYGHYANRGDTVKIKTKIAGRAKPSLYRAIEFFGSSAHCGTFLDKNNLAVALSCETEDVRNIVFSLRELRWDVRFAETHATIRDSGVLCTYPFPLLSEKAQLERRNLRA